MNIRKLINKGFAFNRTKSTCESKIEIPNFEVDLVKFKPKEINYSGIEINKNFNIVGERRSFNESIGQVVTINPYHD